MTDIYLIKYFKKTTDALTKIIILVQKKAKFVFAYGDNSLRVDESHTAGNTGNRL